MMGGLIYCQYNLKKLNRFYFFLNEVHDNVQYKIFYITLITDFYPVFFYTMQMESVSVLVMQKGKRQVAT